MNTFDSCIVWQEVGDGYWYRLHPGKARVFITRAWERGGKWWVQNHTRSKLCVVDDFGSLVAVSS